MVSDNSFRTVLDLTEDGADCFPVGIGVQDENSFVCQDVFVDGSVDRHVGARVRKHGCRSQAVFQSLKCGVFVVSPYEGRVLGGQSVQWR